MLAPTLLVLFSAVQSETVHEKAWEHFGLLNELRAEGFTCPNGASYDPNPVPLRFDCRLWRAARLHSEDMATQGYFSHTSLDGRSPWDRAEEQGISANGENIAAGRSTASGTLQQWKDSDGHCRNMMNPNFHVFAIGYAYESSARYRYYWTQMFKSRDVSDLDTSCYSTTSSTSVSSTNTETLTETTASSTETSTESTTTTVTTESSTTPTATGTTTGTSTGTVTETATGAATGTATGTQTGTATGTTTTAATASGTSTTRATTTSSGSGSGTSTSRSTTTSRSSTLSGTQTGSFRSAGTSVTSTTASTSGATNESTSSLVEGEGEGEKSTTSVASRIEGKLILEVSDPQRFLEASDELRGPLKSFLAEFLEVDVSRISIHSVRESLRRRLASLRRLLGTNLDVDYSVRVETPEELTTVVTHMASTEPSRVKEMLQENLQDDLVEMNMSVEVVDMQVTQTPQLSMDSQNLNQNAAEPLDPIWLFFVIGGSVIACALCLCGCLAMACLKRATPSLDQKRDRSSLPTIHGHLNSQGLQNASSLATMGDLFTWCDRDPPPGPAREAVMLPLVGQIFISVRWLHDLGVAHRDLSLENILLTDAEGGQQIKLIDFGMATVNRTCKKEVRGKQSYQAPEMHTSDPYDAFLADEFALGVSIFAMAVQDYPWTSTKKGSCQLFEYISTFGLMKFLKKRKLRKGTEHLSEVMSAELTQLIDCMLQLDASNRLSLGEACFSGEARRSVWDELWIQSFQGP